MCGVALSLARIRTVPFVFITKIALIICVAFSTFNKLCTPHTHAHTHVYVNRLGRVIVSVVSVANSAKPKKKLDQYFN